MIIGDKNWLYASWACGTQYPWVTFKIIHDCSKLSFWGWVNFGIQSRHTMTYLYILMADIATHIYIYTVYCHHSNLGNTSNEIQSYSSLHTKQMPKKTWLQVGSCHVVECVLGPPGSGWTWRFRSHPTKVGTGWWRNMVATRAWWSGWC